MATNVNDQTDWKALAKTLSDSYSSVLQHSTLGVENIKASLAQLAKYNEHLPLSWFTSQFVHALLTLEKQHGQQDDMLGSIFALLSIWIRRLVSGDTAALQNEPLLPQVVEAMKKTLAQLPDRESTVQARKEAWVGLVAIVGHTPQQLGEGMVVDAIAATIDQYTREQSNAWMNEALDAGVAHCLAHSVTLNAFEMEHCQKLLDSFVRSAAFRYPSGMHSVIAAMEHATDVRSQKKPPKSEADLETLLTIVTAEPTQHSVTNPFPARFTRLALLVGFVRMLQFTRVRKTKKIRDIHQKAEIMFAEQLNAVMCNVMSPDQSCNFADSQGLEPFLYHDVLTVLDTDSIALLVSQCLPNASAKAISLTNNKELLQVLVSCLLTSERVWKCNSVLQSLQFTPDHTKALVTLTNDPFFNEIGRISRAASRVIQALVESDQPADIHAIQNALDRLVGRSANVLIDWDRYLGRLPALSSTDKTSKEFEKAVWSIFKSMLFSFTALLKAVAVDVPNGEGLIKVPGAAQDAVLVFANLHFVSTMLGSAGGFKAYQDTLMNATAYLRHDNDACQLNRLLSQIYREYAPSRYTADRTHPSTMLSPPHRARLTFFTNLIEQVMEDIEDDVLEQDILPVIYPILGWRVILDRELYESAHSAILSVFAMNKPVAREVAGIYAQTLIKGFPVPMTLDQFRYAYSTMIHCLCDMDDALAWLTVGHLLNKIRSLQDEKEATLLPQFILALIDLVKPLSLGPFFGRILEEIQQCVIELPTLAMRQSAMKSLFETVSGPGISDMRRVEAVGWFLELKQRIPYEAS